ncbi:ubiquitin-protein ligase peroxin 10 [Aspergillus saccharolyticus JOP 1030-1]|uniref:RING-type E3 ubiquitin transferase n=1 Tax=Aspergillus saccharolyticus JOP 1030-1 TaxID=1450539 RepID=A0A318ZAB5_9EURO|nr:peroxisome biosynthesis protein [Aspergillus saccharolyticus JOP 1030-1]PYH43397.1 peroxisome biosynthesis protein [Aspergillus saccharolyticus JOP 1030-1]
MADEDLSITTAPAPAPSIPRSGHFYPFATSPDIIRSHEKDVFLTTSLTNQAQSIARSLRGARFAHTHSDAIKRLTETLYFSLTTLIGNRTLGEEYCDLMQLEDDTLQLPSLFRRVGYILGSILLPWGLQRILPAFRQRLRAKLERSIARQQFKNAQTKGAGEGPRPTSSFLSRLRIQQYILEHLDSITSLSPIHAVSIATFYFTGAYYHLSKRFWGLRYIFTKKISENEQRVGYEVLGVLLVLQMAVQGILHTKKVVSGLQQEDQDPQSEGVGTAGGQSDAAITSIENPPSLPLLPASHARYDFAKDSNAVPWMPTGQQRKCTLCLELFRDPSVTTCGHVFCWTCVRDWVREKPECPLCRQEVLLSKVLPLRG